MRLPDLTGTAGEVWSSAGAFVSDLFTPTLRLGVTGLARSGKTVFITALIRNLTAGGRLPFFAADAEGRILAADLEPQPDDAVPRFDYEAHLGALTREEPAWPESTRRISEVRISIAFAPESRLRRALGVGRLNVDIVDYPGEWLLDLAMLGQSFGAWSAEALKLARERSGRIPEAAEWLAWVAARNAGAPEDEQVALEGARLFTRTLTAARVAEPWSSLGPGRFLMPGDLEGSPLLTFCPLEAGDVAAPAKRGSLGAMMTRRYDSYVAHVVRPFFRDHFARLDRQIVLVDALGALAGGAPTIDELERGLTSILAAFRPGANTFLSSLTGRRIDRLLFAATKADHIHHTSHDRLEAVLRLLTSRAEQRARGAGCEVTVMAMASLRATREAQAREGRALLPCIVGVPLAGERVAGTVFDGRREAAVFPGDLPSDPVVALEKARRGELEGALGSSRFPRFRPPRLPADTAGGAQAAAPHIRLDRALDFLIGDWLK